MELFSALVKGETTMINPPAKNMHDNWSSAWPTKVGWYWFFGQSYDEENCDPTLHSVKVVKIPNGVLVIRSGVFWYQSEWSGTGKFIKAVIPAYPL